MIFEILNTSVVGAPHFISKTQILRNKDIEEFRLLMILTSMIIQKNKSHSLGKETQESKSGPSISHCKYSWGEVQVHGGLGLVHEEVHQQLNEVTQEEMIPCLANYSCNPVHVIHRHYLLHNTCIGCICRGKSNNSNGNTVLNVKLQVSFHCIISPFQ